MARGDVVIGRIAFTPADWEAIRLIRAEPYSARCARLAERLYLSHNGAKKRLDHLRLQTGTSSVDELLEWVWRNGKAIDQAVAGSAEQERPGLPLGSGPAAGAGSDDRQAAPGSTAWPTWGTSPEGPLLLGTVVHSPGDNKDVNRRQLLIDLGVLGLAAPLAGVEAVRQGLAAAVAGGGYAADADGWESIVHEYARSFYVTPTDRLLRDLTADLYVLQHHLAAAVGPAQRDLARAGSQLAAISASAWRNAGDPARAQRWWRTARRLADRSADTEACTWVRGKEVVSSLYEQRPLPLILDQAAEAASIAGTLVSAGSVQLCGGLARALAMAGRADEALAALERTADLTDRVPAWVVANGDSMLGWSEVNLRHVESYVHTWLGNTAQAYAAQEAALEVYPESLARDRAKMRLDQSTCMIRDGDVGGGLAYAGQVLEDLPVEHHTESVYTVARSVLRVVPAQEQGRPEAAELRARLALSPSGAQ